MTADEVSRVYRPDMTERRILHYLTKNVNATPREIAKAAKTDENTAKRLYNRLFADNVCSQMILPNYALLGYKVMIVQRLKVKSRSLPEISFITSRIEAEWPNCIDCQETFDGKVYVRSVWRNAEDFKDARTRFHHKHGMDWLAGEEVDMVPLNEQRSIFKVKSLWENDLEDGAPEK